MDIIVKLASFQIVKDIINSNLPFYLLGVLLISMFIFSLYLVYTSYKLEKEAKIYRENIKNEDRIYVSGIGYCTIDSIDSENVLVKVIVRKGRIYPTK